MEFGIVEFGGLNLDFGVGVRNLEFGSVEFGI